MSSKDSLVGQDVALYLDGGWSISGKIARADEGRVLIEKDGLIYMVYRSKISAICLNHKEDGVANMSKPRNSEGQPEGYSESYRNDPDYTGLSLPPGLLTEEAQREMQDNDFSVFFARTESKSK